MPPCHWQSSLFHWQTVSEPGPRCTPLLSVPLTRSVSCGFSSNGAPTQVRCTLVGNKTYKYCRYRQYSVVQLGHRTTPHWLSLGPPGVFVTSLAGGGSHPRRWWGVAAAAVGSGHWHGNTPGHVAFPFDPLRLQVRLRCLSSSLALLHTSSTQNSLRYSVCAH